MNRLRRIPLKEIKRREAILVQIERLTEFPLLILSFVMIPLIFGPLLWDLTESTNQIIFALDMFIWAMFAVDLAVKIIVAPYRLQYVKSHWLDVLIVAIPFFRPLRIIRILIFGSRAFRGAARLAHVDFVLVYAIGAVLLVATLVTTVEQGHDSPLDTFPNALWWSVVTVTTVGYGDMVPVTVIGRGLASVLMLGGIGLFGVLTANFASLLVRKENPNTTTLAQLLQEVQALRAEVTELRQSSNLVSESPPHSAEDTVE